MMLCAGNCDWVMTRLTSCCSVLYTDHDDTGRQPPDTTLHSHLRSLLLLEEELLDWAPAPALLSLHWAQSPVMVTLSHTRVITACHSAQLGWKVKTESAGCEDTPGYHCSASLYCQHHTLTTTRALWSFRLARYCILQCCKIDQILLAILSFFKFKKIQNQRIALSSYSSVGMIHQTYLLLLL